MIHLNKLYLLIVMTLCLVPSLSVATTSSGYISVLGVNKANQTLVNLDSSPDYVACASQFKRFVADLTSEHGQAMYSLILSAQAQNKKIKIWGTSSCDIRGDAESIQFVEMLEL